MTVQQAIKKYKLEPLSVSVARSKPRSSTLMKFFT